MRSARPILAGRRIWLVNSTVVGGGVAEMLRSLVPYALGAKFDARWAVISGPPEFFAATKELHNQLHGHPHRPLNEDARAIYESTLAENAADLVPRVTTGDIVILHDPQSAGVHGAASKSRRDCDLAIARRDGQLNAGDEKGMGIPPPIRTECRRLRLLS